MTNKEKYYWLLNNLSYKAFKLFILMKNENEMGEDSYSYKERFMELYGLSDSTFFEARKELIRKKLVK